MVKKAQMPVKNLVLLIIIIFLILSSVGAITYFLILPQLSFTEDSIITESNIEEYSGEYISPEDYTPSKFDGLDLTREFEISLKRNELELDQFIKTNNLSSTEVYELIDLYNTQAINELRTELDIDQAQATYLWALISSQRRNYPQYEDETAYNLVGIDLLDYNQKIEADVQLPEEIYSDFIPESAQESLAVSFSSGQTLEDYIKEIQAKGEVDKVEENVVGMAIDEGEMSLASDLAKISGAELILKEVYNNLNTTEEQFASSFCTLGFDKDVMLNLDQFVSENKSMNLTFDQIVFGPDGKIIEELSIENKFEYVSENNPGNLVIHDLVNIPLDFDEGKYFVEYAFYNYNDFEKITLRVLLDCHKRMFVGAFNFIERIGGEYYLQEDNIFNPGDKILNEFYLDGISVPLQGEESQFKFYWFLFDNLGNLVHSVEGVVKGGLKADEEEFLYFIEPLILPDNISSGEYGLVLTVENLMNNQFADGFNKLEVEE